MEKPAAYRYSYTSVVVFGILGNILVIISILRQRRLLKNNYYFLVLHLAMCDLAWLVVVICTYVQHELFLGKKSSDKTYCLFYAIRYMHQIAGLYMMLVISVLRYRATIHPLKPDITRKKLRLVCGLGYILGLIAGYGGGVPLCFVQQNYIYTDATYTKNIYTGHIFFIFFAPTVVMAVLYYKVYQALVNQNKYLKSLGSNPVAQSTSGSSFTIVNYIKNRRTFVFCVGTVLCYGFGSLAMTVVLILILAIAGKSDLLMKHVWITHVAHVLRVAGSHSVNPLIYGILDRKFLTFWRLFRQR